MRRMVIALIAAPLIVACVGHGQAQADPLEYGLKEVGASATTTQAGGHPDFVTVLKLKTEREEGTNLPSPTQSATIALPAGLLGNPEAAPQCTAEELVTTDVEDPSSGSGCPQDSQVGITEVVVRKEGTILTVTEPVFNLEPRYGEPARFGFIAVNYPVVIDASLRDGPGEDYGATARVEGVSSRAPLLSARTTIWGVPAEKSHDGERITPYEAINGGVPLTSTGERQSGLVPVPFMLNPTSCGVPQGVDFTVTPYMLPELHSELFAPMAPNTGCGSLEFKPDFEIATSTTEAESGTGLDANLEFPTDGLKHPNLLGEAEQKRVEVTLPEGMTVNPSEAAGGLGACSEAQFDSETAISGAGEGCPEDSKIGSVTATSPLLEEQAEGSLYLAQPHANPFGSLLAVYMVLKVPDRGVVVRLAGEVKANQQTGQLTTTFEGIPQLPVSSFHLHFREGARAPLVTPPTCGAYSATVTFTAWSGQIAVEHPSLEVSSGVGGGPCPSGATVLMPGLSAGTTSNAAGRFSPFDFRLRRSDGEAQFERFSLKLPPGVVAKLASVSFCPDVAIEAARGRSGPTGAEEELASPSCPPTSQLGSTLVGAGVGGTLAYVPGKVYLAGPYRGSKLSIVAITAAKTGPFDLGTVVVREPLRIDAETAEVLVGGASSDPLPRIIQGIPVRVRDIRVYVDRPQFVLNPSSCDPSKTVATVFGAGLGLNVPPATATARFHAAGCGALSFKPKLGLRLIGRTNRGAHPALRAHLKMHGFGEAGIARAQVTLPHTEFIENAHFNTICTRVQFAEGAGNGQDCPSGSVYGHARAMTPILGEPLEGPVFLRSSRHELPDLVVALHNREVDFDLVGRVDSVKGGGIRTTFEAAPDAPVSSFSLAMAGRSKGLFVNSSNLCLHVHRALARFVGHNGKVHNTKPVLRVECGKGANTQVPATP
jgi:hypothetical protein